MVWPINHRMINLSLKETQKAGIKIGISYPILSGLLCL